MTRTAPLLARYLLPLILLLSGLLAAAPIIQSPNDHRVYEAFTLDNGLRVLAVSNPRADKAAVSLDVGVGSGDDPDQYPGLTHFLEHMLFLGTEKYPDAGAYQAYINRHGGNHNAFTAHDRTNYFFDIDQAYLAPTLDRFAQFFIAPLFTPEYVDRERHAVNSEYQSKLKEDSRRGYAAFRAALNPDHPMAKFSVGNLETLRDRPGQPLRQELIDFYHRHYSATNMSLVVLGRESVEELRTLVEQTFTAIPRRELPAEAEAPPLFTPGTLPAELRVSSLRDIHQLDFNFPVPPTWELYRSKPLHYLGALLGHEGQGSLLAKLKEKGWANGLSAGPGINYPDYATFSVSIDLTEAGFDHRDRVTTLLFEYLRLIEAEGVQARIFEEERRINEIRFRFREISRELYYVTGLAANLKRYPVEQVLHGDYLYERFDPTLIRDYLGYLRPDNLLLTATAQDLDTDRTAPWYQTPYALAPLPQVRLGPWQSPEPVADLAIPAPNPFIPADFALKTGQATPEPRVLHQEPGYRLWFQQDNEFQVPRADFYFTLRSPVANESPRHHLLTSLYTRLVMDQLNTYLYPARLAGFQVRVYPHIRGFSVRLSGYSDKQAPLLERIVTTLRQPEVDPQRLALLKADLRRQLENSRKDKPYNQALEELHLQLLSPQWPLEEKLAALDEGIDAQALEAHIKALYREGEAEALAHGNLLRKEAMALSRPLQEILLDGVQPVEVAEGQVKTLDPGLHVEELNIDHNDSAMALYLQGPDDSYATRARYRLLAKVLSSPFYTQLRTEQQLGYVVFASPMPILEHPGIALVVQSPSATGGQLQHQAEAFLARSRDQVASLDDAALAQFRQSLLVELLEKEQRLSERSNRYWQEIDRGHTEFDNRERLAAAIRNTSRDELLRSYDTLERRLVVRSTGQSLSGGLSDSGAEPQTENGKKIEG